MFKKVALGIGILLIVLVVVGGAKGAQIAKLIAGAKNFAPPPETVTVTPAKTDEWEETITAVGNLVATHQVTVSPELGGTVKSLHFDSGQAVQKGQLLLKLDTAVEEAQLASAQADAQLAQTTLERTKRLNDTSAMTKAQLDSAEANSAKTKALVDNLKSIIERKTVRAPFAGRLGIRQVDLGAYVDAGKRLVTLQALGTMYVDFNVPQQRLGQLAAGTPVRVTSESFPGRTWLGTINTLEGSIDTMTRNVKVRAQVENGDEALHPGMFVEVGVVLPKIEKVLVVPSTSIFYSPNGNTVFVIAKQEKDGKESTVVKQKTVEIGERRGDFIAIRGVPGKAVTEQVTVATAKEEPWQPTLTTVGTLVATQQVTVGAEVAGMVTTLAFESGQMVQRGQTLVKLDTAVEQAQLVSAQADAKLSHLTLERTKKLYETNAVAKAELDTSEAGASQMDAMVDNLRGVIERKVIRAPFTGRLGIRQIDLGQYVGAGTAIVTLQALQTMYVDFLMPQQRLTQLAANQIVRIKSDAFAGRRWEGKLSVIDAAVDTQSRNVRVRATFDNKDEALRAGMLVEASVLLPQTENVVLIPVAAVDYAPYGNSVFLVEDKQVDGKAAKIVRQVFVKLGEQRGKLVAVSEGVKAGETVATSNISRLHNGGVVVLDVTDAPAAGAGDAVATINPGDIIVTSGAFKLHDGGPVVITDKLNPAAKLSPKPEDS